ncbi:hypothetical protein Hanom_Chr15g01370181 [Helianthus anomalus]
MARISADLFPLPLHPTLNLRVRVDLNEPAWAGCNVILAMVMQSPHPYAVTTHICVHPDILQEFWRHVKLLHKGRLTCIGSWVMGKAIILGEDVIREVLNLNDDNNILTFTRHQLNNTLTQMGYNVEDPNRPITKSDFIKPWQFLVKQLWICFSKKVVNFHEIYWSLMEPVHAMVQEVPYNFSHYLMKDLTSNLWSNRSFLVYPCFLIRVITS